jgi:hypothetical protein
MPVAEVVVEDVWGSAQLAAQQKVPFSGENRPKNAIILHRSSSQHRESSDESTLSTSILVAPRAGWRRPGCPSPSVAVSSAVALMLLSAFAALLRHTTVVVTRGADGEKVSFGDAFNEPTPPLTPRKPQPQQPPPTPRRQVRVRALPSGPILGAYASFDSGDECAERVTRAVVDGVNVLFWFGLGMEVNEMGEPQFTTGRVVHPSRSVCSSVPTGGMLDWLHEPHWLSSIECVLTLRPTGVGTPGGVRLVTWTILPVVKLDGF